MTTEWIAQSKPVILWWHQKFLRGCCNFGYEIHQGEKKEVYQWFPKLGSRNVELALSLDVVEESSGCSTFSVCEGREHGRVWTRKFFAVWLCAAQVNGCWSYINLWEAERFLGLTVYLSELNGKIEFLWKVSLFLPGALCNLDLFRTACLYFEFGTTDSSFYCELFICQEA